MEAQGHLYKNLKHSWMGICQKFRINPEICWEVFFQLRWTSTLGPTVIALSIGDLFFKSWTLTIIGIKRNNEWRKSQDERLSERIKPG